MPILRYMSFRQLGMFAIAATHLYFAATLLSADPVTPSAAKSTPSADTAKDAADKAKDEEYYELLKLFVDTLDQVERNYVQDISRRDLVEAAIQGMLTKLDQHTNYISPRELDQFKTGVESEFGGIGINVMTRNGELSVIGAVPGSPAHRAGLASGDIITQVEGKPLKGLAIDDAIQRLKGKAGTTVEFVVRHAKDSQEETLKLTREIVRMETVVGHQRKPDNTWDYWLEPEKKLAYIRVGSFSRHTAEELRKALTTLRAEGLKGLIFDLRFNPGGLLSSAIEVSDMFVKEGRIVSTSGRNVEARHWDAHKRGTFDGFPMVVLVNRGSASASEIVSACLQDHQRAAVAGERSWGKGSVQNVVELEGGHSALKLTTAKYFRPSGKDIHRDENEGEDGEWGVKPEPTLELRLNIPELHELSGDLSRRMLLWTEGENSKADAPFVDRQLQKAVEHLTSELSKPAEKPADAVD
jgi:carboxyl-terminal processing protease